jgi:PTH1 family peptidyl-tRNA hydrolase
MTPLRLVAGLGNPGPGYARTRHNVGFWWVDAVAESHGGHLRPEQRFHGSVGRVQVRGEPLWLLQPTTFMNRSGQSVGALARFYRIPPEQILVIHDDLDLPPGTVRLKRGGGHGGHNGLRDIIAHLGSRDFLRLRIGIGHPGEARQVTDYVLGVPSAADRGAFEEAIEASLRVLPLVVEGQMQKAMQRLHTPPRSLAPDQSS